MSEAEKTARRLRETLPVPALTAKVVEESPEFAKLLTALSQHVTADGTSTHVARDVEAARKTLRQEKGRWLEQEALYSELQELVLDKQTKGSDAQFYDAVSEMVTLTEISDSLNCHPDPSSELTLLGLKKEDVDRWNPHKRHLLSIQQKLIPDIESCLRKTCDFLLDFYDASFPVKTAATSDKMSFARASQMPSMLEAELARLDGQKKQLREDKSTREVQIAQYNQTLMDSLSTLETLISRHRLRTQSEHDRINSEWLTARCDAMCLKIKTMQQQLLCDTYHKDTVGALTVIKQLLDKATVETEQKLSKAKSVLGTYETVGMGFDSLVDEYTKLKSELENKEWTLKQVSANI